MTLVGSRFLGPRQPEYFDVGLSGVVTYGIYVYPDEAGLDFELSFTMRTAIWFCGT
jgi:hypothetical protein